MLGGTAAVALAVVATLVGLFASGAAPTDPGLSLTSGGLVVAWTSPLASLLIDLATIGCAGSLLSVLYLLRTDGGPIGVQGQRAVRDTRLAAVVWALSALLGALAIGADILGVSFTLLFSRLGAAAKLPEIQALLLTAVLAALIAGTARRIRTSPHNLTAGLLAIAAMLPPLLTAFPRDESGVVPATLGLAVHVFAATAWIGGLAGVVRYGRGSTVGLPTVLRRFGQVALVGAVAVLLSGLLTGLFRQSVVDGRLFSGGYGALLLAKTVAFVLLIAGGWWHRRQVIKTRTDAGSTFWRLVGVELFVMAIAIGLSVAMAHTPLG
ncbi:copper resistance D family protein [Kribbella deserti]|uniref:Copper resistance D family protein n=1 Tax=Kribbella deserti TaxID=1926257 RepID=A0ABV6QMU2_9ACTN